MTSAYDHWKQNDFAGERRQAEIDAEWEAYEAWAEQQSASDQHDDLLDFVQQLKGVTGTMRGQGFGGICTVECNGWDLFQNWQMDNRWPGRQRAAA